MSSRPTEIKCNTPACDCALYPAGDIWRRWVYRAEKRKLIWLDIPKCASTTIREHLQFTEKLDSHILQPENDKILKNNINIKEAIYHIQEIVISGFFNKKLHKKII